MFSAVRHSNNPYCPSLARHVLSEAGGVARAAPWMGMKAHVPPEMPMRFESLPEHRKEYPTVRRDCRKKLTVCIARPGSLEATTWASDCLDREWLGCFASCFNMNFNVRVTAVYLHKSTGILDLVLRSEEEVARVAGRKLSISDSCVCFGSGDAEILSKIAL